MLNLLHPVKNSQLSAEGSFIRAIFDDFRLKGCVNREIKKQLYMKKNPYVREVRSYRNLLLTIYFFAPALSNIPTISVLPLSFAIARAVLP